MTVSQQGTGPMRVALVQVASPVQETPQKRRDRVGQLLRDGPPADLYVLPELWGAGYFSFEQYAERAEAMDGPTVNLLSDFAREHGAYVHVGSFLEDRGNGLVSNTAALVDPEGTMVSSYAKIHVFGYQSAEAELLEPGDTVSVVDTGYGRVASTTCYDLRFPGLWQRLSDLDAQLAVVPAAWPAARVEHWRLFTSVRAVEHQMFVLACNAAGEQHGTVLAGHSRVVDPWGNVLLELGSEPEIGVCEIDPSQVGAVRAEFPVLADRLRSYSALQNRERNSSATS